MPGEPAPSTPTQILIVGLGSLGASIGLALAQAGVHSERIGYDPNRERARAAIQLQAVDRRVSNPSKSARQADLVLLALGVDQAGDTIEALAQDLKAGALLIDLSSMSTRGLEFAAQFLPAGRYYIAALPVAGSLDDLDQEANADRFRNGLLALCMAPDTPQSVFEVANGLAYSLGAQPFFIDPLEAEAARQSGEGLPALLGAALMLSVSQGPGWPDLQRLVGQPFAQIAQPNAESSAADLARLLTETPEHVLPRLEALQQQIETFRRLIAGGEREALRNELAAATETYQDWLTRRKLPLDAGLASNQAELSKNNLMGRLFGSGRRNQGS
jgi:prephenate dehydrogenase